MKLKEIQKHVLTGVSYMIPVIVAGGILRSLALAFGGYDIGDAVEAGATAFSNMNPFTWTGFWWAVNQIGSYAMTLAIAVMAAGTAFSIAGRQAIAPALILGHLANMSKAGFIGAILVAFMVGMTVRQLMKINLPESIRGLMPVLIIPSIATFACGMVFLILFAPPLSWLMNKVTDWIVSLNGSASAIAGAVIGAGMGFDLGGPVNKTASLAANALGADGFYSPVAAKIIGGMTPPIGAFLATLIGRKKFTKEEQKTGISALFMGLSYITEGAIPFAAKEPVKFIISSMCGSALAGGMVTGFGVESMATHGGIFVVPLMNKPGIFVLALAMGSLLTAILYSIWKTPSDQMIETIQDEKIDDIEIQFDL